MRSSGIVRRRVRYFGSRRPWQSPRRGYRRLSRTSIWRHPGRASLASVTCWCTRLPWHQAGARRGDHRARSSSVAGLASQGHGASEHSNNLMNVRMSTSPASADSNGAALPFRSTTNQRRSRNRAGSTGCDVSARMGLDRRDAKRPAYQPNRTEESDKTNSLGKEDEGGTER